MVWCLFFQRHRRRVTTSRRRFGPLLVLVVSSIIRPRWGWGSLDAAGDATASHPGREHSYLIALERRFEGGLFVCRCYEWWWRSLGVARSGGGVHSVKVVAYNEEGKRRALFTLEKRRTKRDIIKNTSSSSSSSVATTTFLRERGAENDDDDF